MNYLILTNLMMWKLYHHHYHDNKIMGINKNCSLIRLKINGLNFLIKRHRLMDYIYEKDILLLYIKKYILTDMKHVDIISG